MKTMQHCAIAMLIVFVTMLFTAPQIYAESQAPSEPSYITVGITNKETGVKRTFTFNSVAIGNLKLLKQVLTDIGLTRYTETLQAIMLVETRAGIGGSIGLPNADWKRRSYGLMQITLPTARVMLQRNPAVARKYFGDKPIREVTNQELIKFLIDNKEANITLGALVYDTYVRMTHGEWARAVAGYNMGIGNALDRPDAIETKYVSDVREMLVYARLLNRELKKIEDAKNPQPKAPVAKKATHKDNKVSANKEKNNGKGKKATPSTIKKQAE